MGPQEMAERTVALCQTDGCVVIAQETSTANLRWAGNSLTTNGVTYGRHLTVIAMVDGATGTAAAVVTKSGATEDALEALVRSATDAARSAPPAEDAQPLVGPDQAASSDWDGAPGETGIATFSSFIPALADAFDQARSGQRLLFGYAEHSVQSTYLASSSGLRLRHDQPSGQLEVNLKSTDYARSAWAGAATADFTEVDPIAMEAQLGERLDWARRRVEMPAGRYEILLPPGATADLMIYLYYSASARDAHDGRSAFSKPGGGTRVGERLADVPVTLRSDPAAPGMECPRFVIAHSSSAEQSVFDNGLPLRPTKWIANGELAALLQTRHSAQLTDLPVTPAIDNLIMEGPPDGRSLADMAARTDRGLLLTCLWYIRVVDAQTLLLTGLTRDGVYLIEGGEVVGATNNFRFNESPIDLLRRVDEVGPTERCLAREFGDYFNCTAMPTLRVADFNMSSVSQAS